jgi:PST family polysaccharide transporter
VLSQVLKLLMNLVALVTISRILTPAQFGLFAMVTAILGVGDIFRDFGLSMAAIQSRELSGAQRSNLFWINLGVGAVLSIAAFALSHPISTLYGQASLAAAVAVVGTTFLLNGAAAQFRVGLIREDRFSALTIADVVSVAAALGVAITLSLLGFGVWALVVQSVAQAALAFLLVAGQLRWRPGLPNRAGSIRSMLHFGMNLLGTQLLSYAGRNVDNILLGRFWGPGPLGFYSKAFTLYSMPQQQALAPFTDLALNTLSRSSHDLPTYRRRVQKMQMVANYGALTMFGLLIALAVPAVSILLGPRWGETAVLLQILSIGGVFQLLGNVYYWIFLTEGLTRMHFRISLLTQPIAIVCIVAGLPFGAEGVAWGAAAGLFVEWLVPATFGARRTKVSARQLLLNLRRPLIFCGGMAASAHLASLAAPSPAIASVAVGLGAATLWCALCLLAWPAVRRDLGQVLELARAAARRRGSSDDAADEAVPMSADATT